MSIHHILTKEEAEETISKHYHNKWKSTYIGQVWRDLKEREVFNITSNLKLTNLGDEKYNFEY